MEQQMSKRFIRVAVVLVLLLLTAEGAGQDLKHRAVERRGEMDSPVNIEIPEESAREDQDIAEECGQKDREPAEEYEEICQTNYTKIAYDDGSYYYPSAADHMYLYQSDEDGEIQECLAEQVPREIYVKGEWVYFTNVSAGETLYRIHKDSGRLEEVFARKIDRFFPMRDSFYCLSEGDLYSWSEEQGAELLYEGGCRWLSTDGQFLYLEIEETEDGKVNDCILMIDEKGNVKARQSIWLYNMIPEDGRLYYTETMNNCSTIYCMSIFTGEVEKLTEIPGRIVVCFYGFIKRGGRIYAAGYDSNAENCYIYQYDITTGSWSTVYSKRIASSDMNSLYMYEKKYFSIAGGKLFISEPYMEGEMAGKGELWYRIDLEDWEEELFEDMEPLQVRSLYTEDIFLGATQESLPYLSEDYEYDASQKNHDGNLIDTNIGIPQFNDGIPAYRMINQKIMEDAENFYKEQAEYAESIYEILQCEGRAYGFWDNMYVYADSHYISIVYRKYLGFSGKYEDVKYNGYEVKLYSAETGEEIEIWDLFHVSKEEVLLRFGFAIRKINFGTVYLDGDFGLQSVYEPNYILTDDGIDIFFVENAVTKVFHYEIGYEELEDILQYDMDERTLSDQEKRYPEASQEGMSDDEYMKELEVYRDVLEEYAQAIREDTDEVYAVGKWKYVYDVLYYAGKEDGILYYSFSNLSNHDNRELIVGRLYDGEYIPYAIYREWGAGVELFCIAERYKMIIYEGGIVELIGSGISCPIMYWTVGEEVTIETLEMKVEDGKIVGYTREIFLGSHESIKEEITEEEYLEIIEQYTAVPVELEWRPFEGF